MNPTLKLADPDMNGVELRVRFDRWDGERAQFWYGIYTGPNPLLTYEGTDLRLGANTPPRLNLAMMALLDFLGAFVEAQRYPDSDNRDMFPGLEEWAKGADADYLYVLKYELGADDE